VLAGRLGQSQSIGEILAGVALGPSLFGWVAPGAFHAIFPSDGPNLVPYFSHLGLVLALFLIGMAFDFRTVVPHRRSVVGVALGTLVAPIGATFLIGPWLGSLVPGEHGYLPYTLFVGMCLAITAIPIMGRVLIEQGLSHTRAGVVAITTGAAKDLVTWFLLAVVTGIARPPFDPWAFDRMIVLSIGLGVVALTAGRRLIAWVQARAGWVDGRPSPGLMVLVLLDTGLDLGVVPTALFSVLVGNAVLRNVAVTPVLRRCRARGLPPAVEAVDDALAA
jgi:Kef-type K+ transport system membrane component KefB